MDHEQHGATGRRAGPGHGGPARTGAGPKRLSITDFMQSNVFSIMIASSMNVNRLFLIGLIQKLWIPNTSSSGQRDNIGKASSAVRAVALRAHGGRGPSRGSDWPPRTG
jgi:hypothetical protein